MKFYKLLLIFSFIFSQFAISSEVSDKERQDILTMAHSVAEASVKLDTETLMSLLTQDVVIEFKSTLGQGQQFDYAMYKLALINMFENVKNYEYKQTNKKIEKLSKNDFKFSLDLKQTYEFDGRQIKDDVHEAWYLKYIDSSLKVYKVVVSQ